MKDVTAERTPSSFLSLQSALISTMMCPEVDAPTDGHGDELRLCLIFGLDRIFIATSSVVSFFELFLPVFRVLVDLLDLEKIAL